MPYTSTKISQEERCPNCDSPLKIQYWESSDGAYEDAEITCTNGDCTYKKWEEGADA